MPDPQERGPWILIAENEHNLNENRIRSLRVACWAGGILFSASIAVFGFSLFRFNTQKGLHRVGLGLTALVLCYAIYAKDIPFYGPTFR